MTGATGIRRPEPATSDLCRTVIGPGSRRAGHGVAGACQNRSNSQCNDGNDEIFRLANAAETAHHAARSYSGGSDVESAPAGTTFPGCCRDRVRAVGYVHERRRADSPALVSKLPSSRADGADVAAHL